MSKRRKNKGRAGNGIGPHQAHSAMGRGTRTPTKQERRRKADRKHKQEGWR